MPAGVARQHAGPAGQVENCQGVVFCAYVTPRAHALFGFRLCLPEAWCQDKKRRERAQVPEGVAFAAKTELGTAMVAGAVTAGVPFGWAAGDNARGRASKLRAAREKDGKGHVPGVPCGFRVRLHHRRGKTRAGAVARLVPARCREARPRGPGRKGHRDHHWARAAPCSPRHWLLIRRGISAPSELAFLTATHPRGGRCPCRR